MAAEAAPVLAPPVSRDELLTGWGRTAPSLAHVRSPGSEAELVAALRATGPRGVVARGLGRAYGDAAQNAGGDVLDLTGLDDVHELDVASGRVRVGAGVSLDALTRALLPFGWFPPVVPGTNHVTVGGAIAADIHGKNHHVEGAFTRHVESLVLLTAAGERLELRAGDEGFAATAGGMGLTGVVAEATLRLHPIQTAKIRADTERASDLDDVLRRMEEGDHLYRYSVAWIDLLARGSRLGRSVLIRGDHATREELGGDADRASALAGSSMSSLAAPPWVPTGLLRRSTVRAFNEAFFRRAPREERGALQSLRAFFHPLDGVRGWNRLYGASGFVQYQFVVPFGREDALRAIIERLVGAQVPSFLAVLKRFGDEAGLISFPMRGWTLALDIPAGLPGLGALLDALDASVAEAGGRIYLAKDARLRPELLAAMYPRLDAWREARARLDPEGAMRSDLSRRLGLI